MFKIILMINIVLVVISRVIFAGVNPAAFLDIGVGARALGMGGAFTAVADDATASYWNPAGLGRIESFQSSFMFQQLAAPEWPGIEDITPSYQFFNIVVPFNKVGLSKKGAMALSFILFKINDIPLTYIDESGDLYRGSFDDSESAYCLSIGYPVFFDELFVGGSAKLISQNFSGIHGGTALGWDIDAGALILLTSRLNLGLLVRRGPELKWENGRVDRDFISSKIGMSYNYKISRKIGILTACDFIQKKNMPIKGSAGLELSFLPKFGKDFGRINSVAIRAGINRLAIENRYGYLEKINKNINWNAGAGIGLGVVDFDIKFDYNFSYHQLGSEHRISIIMEL